MEKTTEKQAETRPALVEPYDPLLLSKYVKFINMVIAMDIDETVYQRQLCVNYWIDHPNMVLARALLDGTMCKPATATGGGKVR